MKRDMQNIFVLHTRRNYMMKRNSKIQKTKKHRETCMPVNSFKPFRVEQVRETSLITRRVVVVSRRDVLNAPTTYHTDHDTESTLDQLN